MGEVWRAKDAEGHLFAAKILRPDISGNSEMVKRFVAERNLLLSVDHPNVVGVHDLVVEGETLAIIMDIVEGPDLRQMLKAAGTFTQSDAALVCAELAEGLQAIHEQHIVHRDMKPANVLVDETGTELVPRITDFGVSRLTETGLGAANPTMVAGTPHYMAPELLMNQTPTPASDLYSLGIMLYELATGVTPFADRNPAAAMQAQLSFDPGRPDGLDDRIWDILVWLTRKDPSRRPESAAQAAHALREASDQTLELPALTPLRTPPPPVPVDAPSNTVLAPGLAATMLGSGTGQSTGASGWASGAATTGTPAWPVTNANGLSAIGFPHVQPGYPPNGVSQSVPGQKPGRGGGVKTAIIIALATLLVAAIVIGIVLFKDRDNAEEPASPEPSTSATSETPTPTPTPTPSVDERTHALNELNDARSRSMQNLVLDGRWVLQIDSKYEGIYDPQQTTADGSHTFTLPDIYDRYQENVQYAAAHGIHSMLLLKGGDFGKQIFSLPEDTWVTIADPGGIDSYDAGLAVCSSLYPNLSGDALLNSCLPRQLTVPHG
ncbi:serine/threonine protein kinase [Propionibacterium australiense]|nr:serine/threonine protein kinase [Propionibacterium australiense]RLP09949.1 serine/threonine protein kinase [Propionibacterium australiense]